MASLPASLPDSPRRRWDPSQWNLARVGATLGSTLAIAACNDDVTVAEETETSTDELDDQTDYTDYADWSEDYTDYSDYSDHWDDYSDYSDYSDWHDDDYWVPECYYDRDCGPGQVCESGYCEPIIPCRFSSDCDFDEFCSDDGYCTSVELPSQCPAPEIEEIPLPAEVQGIGLALTFVNVDGDPAEELAILRDDVLVLVDGDQATVVAHTGVALDGIAAADVDGDGFVDLIATAATKLNSRVFLGDGLGGFAGTGTGPAMRLDDSAGLDWPSGGPGEVLARTQADEAVILSNVIEAVPAIEALELGPVEGLTSADFDDDMSDDVAALQGCQPVVNFQTGDMIVGLEALGPSGSCSIAAGHFDDSLLPDLLVLRTDSTISVITMFVDLAGPYTVGLIGDYELGRPTDFGNQPRSIALEAGAELELVSTQNLRVWCRAILDELPLISRFAVGDFDGDGDHELATIATGGLVQLWSDD